jgi:hypothetical protein
MENINVKVADQCVETLNLILKDIGTRRAIPVPVDALILYLKCMERLAALERHLFNLTSDSHYKNNG